MTVLKEMPPPPIKLDMAMKDHFNAISDGRIDRYGTTGQS